MDIDETTEARVGNTLKGKWRLERLLGKGGMASVYAARHRNGSRVAIKVLHPELSMHSNMRARFLREGYAANAVEHRGAVRVLDDDTDEDGAVFLVMELLEGESLDVLRKRAGGTLAVPDVLAIADQLLDVLAAAHDKGIIHRDIKPQNLFLTTDGVLKVLDFGIAQLRNPSAGDIERTKTGMGMGSPGYMSPEQARGRWREVDAQSDLWAVGATMFRVLTGRPVHRAPIMNEALLLAMTATAPLIGTVLPEIPPEVAVIVDRALAFDKAARWPNARAMQAAVRGALHALSAGDPGVPRDTQSPPSAATPGEPVPGAPQPAELDVTGQKTTQKLSRPRLPVQVVAAEAPEPPGTVSGIAAAAGDIVPSKGRVPPRAMVLAGGALSLLVAGLVAVKALESDGVQAEDEPSSRRPAASATAAPTSTARGDATLEPAGQAATASAPAVPSSDSRAGEGGPAATWKQPSEPAPSTPSTGAAGLALPPNPVSSAPATTAAPPSVAPGASGQPEKADEKPVAASPAAPAPSASPSTLPASTGVAAQPPSPRPARGNKEDEWN